MHKREREREMRERERKEGKHEGWKVSVGMTESSTPNKPKEARETHSKNPKQEKPKARTPSKIHSKNPKQDSPRDPCCSR